MRKITYLISKEDYLKKKARHRFAYFKYIEASGFNLTITGPGWNGNSNWLETARKHIKESVALIYYPRPTEWDEILPVTNCPTIVEFDEARTKEGPLVAPYEIKRYSPTIAISHFYTDFKDMSSEKYKEYFVNTELVHIPIGIDQSVFRREPIMIEQSQLGLAASIGELYPVRSAIVSKLSEKEIFQVYKPNPNSNPNKQWHEYSLFLKSSQFVIVCSSKYKYSLAKYGESLLCGCWLIGDLPNLSPDLEAPPLELRKPPYNLDDIFEHNKIRAFRLHPNKLNDPSAENNNLYVSAKFYADRIVNTIGYLNA